MERLQKVIANSGYCSRRKAEELIINGKVLVNGKKVTELGTRACEKDSIVVNGEEISSSKKEYYILNKPRGVVSTTSDEKGRKNVVDLIDTKTRIYPVGRLDYDTTGLIILTNDGDLANKLMHPSFKVEKTYMVKLEGILTMEDYHEIKEGIVIDKVKLVPTRLKIRKKDLEKKTTMVEISIVEGRNHIIKKLFETIKKPVIKLKRTKYGILNLGNLQSSEYRILSLQEINELKKLN